MERLVVSVANDVRCCGTCKFWVPETKEVKPPWSHCGINGKTKVEDDKPCLAWILKKQ